MYGYARLGGAKKVIANYAVVITLNGKPKIIAIQLGVIALYQVVIALVLNEDDFLPLPSRPVIFNIISARETGEADRHAITSIKGIFVNMIPVRVVSDRRIVNDDNNVRLAPREFAVTHHIMSTLPLNHQHARAGIGCAVREFHMLDYVASSVRYIHGSHRAIN
jgi:hypothetical protein